MVPHSMDSEILEGVRYKGNCCVEEDRLARIERETTKSSWIKTGLDKGVHLKNG